MIQVSAIPAFQDNYIWLLVDDAKQYGIVVDPGDATPVLDKLSESNISLIGIFITHHHADHVGGVKQLLDAHPVPVYGPGSIPQITHPVNENDQIFIQEFNETFHVMEIPGHTLDHIAYYTESRLFCGDTLFMAGCGRLFEGSPEQMLESLNKIKQLPENLYVYCAHEYTLNNLEFALTIEPNNEALKARYRMVKELRAADTRTVPGALAVEKNTNPFLRTDQPEIRASIESQLNKENLSELEIFTEVRKLKDKF